MQPGDRVVLAGPDIDRLVGALQTRGYDVVGPTVRDGAIIYDRLASASDLPVGLTDEQAPGRYRLAKRQDGAFFGTAKNSSEFSVCL